MGIESAIIGGILGLDSDAAQRRAQRGMMKDQAEINKEVAKYNQQLGLETWEKTNLPAQVKMAKEAGLSIAGLFENGAGGSGTLATGNASGVSSGAASNATDRIRANNELALLGAQAANLEANTKKTEAETEKISGVDTENTKQQIKTGQAQEAKTRAEQGIAEIEESNMKATRQETLNAIVNGSKKVAAELKIIENSAEINQATKTSQINQIRANAIGAVLENASTEAGTKLKYAQIKGIEQNIMQEWQKVFMQRIGTEQENRKIAQGDRQLNQQDRKIAIEKLSKIIDAQLGQNKINQQDRSILLNSILGMFQNGQENITNAIKTIK